MAKTARKSPSLWRRRILWALVTMLLTPFVLAIAYIWLPVPATPLMVWRAVNGYGWHQQWVPLKRLPRHVARAIVATEDNRFCQHSGVDWVEVQEVYDDWQEGETNLRGASTISMQVARNVFLWPNQDVIRKGLEVPFTYLIEHLWGKQRIMEVYVNVVEFGPGVYGVEAAAQHYFNKRAKNLTLAETAKLASILPSPLRWGVQLKKGTPGPWVRRRSASIPNRINQLGPLLSCLP
jgi:monofunctional biosynthetic peptidoglycan transglycosylase